MKYVVAYKVPAYVLEVIKNGYKRVTGRDLSVDNLHISLIYPFFIHSTHSEKWILGALKELDLKSINSRLGQVDVFEQKDKLLYISIEPYRAYYDNHLIINRVFRSAIQIDTDPFINKELPPYKPHIGIDYNFDGDYLTLHSLRLEGIEERFESGRPRFFKFDENNFSEVTE